jgi:hypothetical protein
MDTESPHPANEESKVMKMKKYFVSGLWAFSAAISASGVTYPVVDTGQIRCYDDAKEIIYPAQEEDFYGQDAQYRGLPFSFKENGDGTVNDLNTGLMWQQVPSSRGFSWKEAVEYCNELELGGYDDWRIPTLKELFALQNFSKGWPYIDTEYFSLATGHIGKDEQFWCAEYYKFGKTEGMDSAFGVNAVTGHIKAYPSGKGPMGGKHVRAVRGELYGINEYVDNKNGTITDKATGLMWMQADSGHGMEWKDALAYAENAEFAGYSDWRLPSVKELQSIVDYSGIFPAIDPLFNCTSITNEANTLDYPYYWTSTSAQFSSRNPGYYYAWYVAFGRAVDGSGRDSHGAGAVRFDTKTKDGPKSEGGERYTNYVRLVRGGTMSPQTEGPELEPVTVSTEDLQQDGPPQGMPQGSRSGGNQMGGPPPAMSHADFITRLDKDGDGKISKTEFDGPDQHFTQLDQNKDGYLNESEAPTGMPPKGQGPQ